LSSCIALHDNHAPNGTASNIVIPGGMTTHAGRLRVKIATRGWNSDGSSKVPA
jgi:hypothetical protein